MGSRAVNSKMRRNSIAVQLLGRAGIAGRAIRRRRGRQAGKPAAITAMSKHLEFGHARRKAAFIFVFITVVLDILALGMIIPVLPKLIERFSGGDTAHAAGIVGLFGTAWALMQFVFSPLVGALSDRFGRRPIILLSNLGLGLDYLLMALAPDLTWLFVGRIVSGITAASISTAMAYVADITPPEHRAANFGKMGMAFGLGFVFGPLFGGLLADVSLHAPFWVAAGLSLANAAYGVLVVPESLAKDKRTPFAWSRANPLGSLGLLRSHRTLFGLATVGLLSNIAHYVLPSTAVLYVGHRYGWSPKVVGLMLTLTGVANVVVQGALVRPAVAAWGDRRVLMLGLLAGAIGFGIYGWAPTGGWFWLGVPILAVWGLAGPTAQGLMSQLVGSGEQGQLQGAASSVNGIAGMIGPAVFSQVFSYFIGVNRAAGVPGAAFLLAAALLLVALAVSAVVTRPGRHPSSV